MKPVFVCMLVPKRVLCLLLALGIAVVGGLGSLAATATTVVPLSLSETVRQADAIVVGTITGHQSRWGDASHRWMQTDYTLAVEDVVYPSEQNVPIWQTIVLTYWGGTIGGETQAVADIRLPVDGERLVMMLHSRWAHGGTVAPTVGFNHGLFSVVGDSASGKPVVRDAAGGPLAVTKDGKMVRGNVRGAVAAGATAMDLVTFTGWLRANVHSIKTTPATSKPTVDQNDPRVMKVFAKSPAAAGSFALNSVRTSANAVAAARDPAAEAGAYVPAAVSATETTPSSVTSATQTIPHPEYSSSHQAHLPIVINSFPSTFAPWTPEDQYQMSKWNYYASNVFRVYTTPTGTYAWPDGIFDLAGWPSEADVQGVYGFSWYCGSGCMILGVTFKRYDFLGWIVEADIALNPAASWTLDDEWVFSGSYATGFRQTMIHELGHVHGLNHNFSFLALMNYLQPNNYRSFAFPFADDAAGIRAEYPSNAVALTDLAVYLFSETDPCYDGTTFYTCIAEATYPSSIAPGGSLTVNDYHVENVGTTTIATPTIEWYLTIARTFGSSYYYLGQSMYPSLSPFTYFIPSTVGRTFSVPANVPIGNYYLAAYIRDDFGPGQAAFPFSNNHAFSFGLVSVTIDTQPNAFSFAARTGVTLNTVVTSNTITPTGYNTPAPVSVSGGRYSINGGTFMATAGTISPGQTVALRLASSGNYSTPMCATLTIGGVAGQFCATTQAATADSQPDAFSFTAQTGVALNAVVTSNTITPTGYNAPAPVGVTGGSYSIDGGAFVTTAGTIGPGHSVALRLTSSGSNRTRTCANLTIGGVRGMFCATTVP